MSRCRECTDQKGIADTGEGVEDVRVEESEQSEGKEEMGAQSSAGVGGPEALVNSKNNVVGMIGI